GFRDTDLADLGVPLLIEDVSDGVSGSRLSAIDACESLLTLATFKASTCWFTGLGVLPSATNNQIGLEFYILQDITNQKRNPWRMGERQYRWLFQLRQLWHWI